MSRWPSVNKNIITVIAVALTIGISSSNAWAKCEQFPEVSWWGHANHDGVRQYVESHHDGIWLGYINKWEGQLKKLKNIHGEGKAVRTPDGQLISGSALANYIEKVGKRVSINYCLAKEDAKLKKTKLRNEAARQALLQGETVENVATGNPERGMLVASRFGCFECHGKSGHSINPDAPNLAGQKVSYIVKQLNSFAAAGEGMLPIKGESYRFHPIMSEKAMELSPADMEDVAAYFAGF